MLQMLCRQGYNSLWDRQMLQSLRKEAEGKLQTLERPGETPKNPTRAQELPASHGVNGEAISAGILSTLDWSISSSDVLPFRSAAKCCKERGLDLAQGAPEIVFHAMGGGSIGPRADGPPGHFLWFLLRGERMEWPLSKNVEVCQEDWV